jgi:hypothetical protein
MATYWIDGIKVYITTPNTESSALVNPQKSLSIIRGFHRYGFRFSFAL